jgi:hypothetical protein
MPDLESSMLDHCTDRQLKDLLALASTNVKATRDGLLQIGDSDQLEHLLTEMCTGTEQTGGALLVPVDRKPRTYYRLVPSTCGRRKTIISTRVWAQSHGQGVYAYDPGGWTALMCAAYGCRARRLKALIAAGGSARPDAAPFGRVHGCGRLSCKGRERETNISVYRLARDSTRQEAVCVLSGTLHLQLQLQGSAV